MNLDALSGATFSGGPQQSDTNFLETGAVNWLLGENQKPQ